MDVVRTYIFVLAFMIIGGIFCMDEYHTEYVNVKKISGHIKRNKRSTELEFPAKTVFRFNMADDEVVLDLQHSSPHPRKHIPIYTVNTTGIRYKDTTRQVGGFQENFALYQNLTNGASVLIKCPHGNIEDVELFGEFSHNRRHYQIEPLPARHRAKRELNNTIQHRNHVVRRQALPEGDFYGDAISPPSMIGTKNSRYSSDVYPDVKEKVPGVQVLQKGRPKRVPRDIQGDQGSSRRRRSTNTLYIEYLVVADNKNFQRWKDKVAMDTGEDEETTVLNAMSEFYQFVVNGIDLRFRSATGSPGPEVRVVFSQLLVSTTPSTSPWTEHNRIGGDNVDDSGVLYDFAMWKNSIKQYLPRHDHAALFTGYNMATHTSTNPIGLGYLNMVCHSSWAVSEIEETYNAITVHIAAHELGHNMGTRHDGSGNGCSPTKWNLMAPRLPTVYKAENRNNPWKFSSCSQTNIRNYIRGLSRDNCLKNRPNPTNFAIDNNVQPGIKYSPDEQCSMTHSGGAVLCREKLYGQWDSVCYAMQCKKKGAKQCEGRYFPFDGTPCGDKKWCQAGSCVWSTEASTADPTCPFGDDPHVDCSTEGYCEDYVYKNVFCCNACRKTTTTTTSTTTTTTTTTTTSTTTDPPITTSTTDSPTTTSTTNSPITTSVTDSHTITSTTDPPTTTSTTDSPTTTDKRSTTNTSPVITSTTTQTETPSDSTTVVTTSTTLSTQLSTSSSQATSSSTSTRTTPTTSKSTTEHTSISTPEPTTTLSTSITETTLEPTSSSSSSTSSITSPVSTVQSTLSSSLTTSSSTISTTETTEPVTTSSTITNSTESSKGTSAFTDGQVTSTSISTDGNVTNNSSTKHPATSAQTTKTSEHTSNTKSTSDTTSVSTASVTSTPSVTTITDTPFSTKSTTTQVTTTSVTPTDYITKYSTTQIMTTNKETSPKSTTDSITTTSSTIHPHTTTKPKEELSNKMQKMISLFISAAIIV